MRPLSLTLTSFTRSFASLTLDLSKLEPGLVAVVGPNGAGKTTLMDALGGPVALWRELSTKPGGLKEYCTGRDASIDLTFAFNGHVYRSLINVDPDYSKGIGKQEAFLYEDGAPICNGRLTDFDALVQGTFDAKGNRLSWGLFPSKEMYYASAFGAQQQGGNFFSLTPAERKALFAELLGLGALQATAERARAARGALDAACERLEADAAAVLIDWGRARSIEADIATHTAALAPLEEVEATADRAVASAVDAGQRAIGLLQQLDGARRAATDRQHEIDVEIATADQGVISTEKRIADLDALCADAILIRANAAVLATARETKRTATIAWAAKTDLVKAARSAHVTATESRTRALADVGRAEMVINAAAAATRDLPAIEKRLAPLAQTRIDHGRIDAEVRAEEVALAPMRTNARNEAGAADIALRTARLALETATGKAALLDGVPCRGGMVIPADERVLPFGVETEPVDCGTCRFLTDARAASASIEALTAKVATLAAAKLTADTALEAAQERDALLTEARSRRDALARTIAELAPLETRAATLRAQTAGVAAADASLVEASARVAALTADETRLAVELSAAETDRAACVPAGQEADRIIALHPLAESRLRDLDAAEARLPDLRTQRDDLTRRRSMAVLALARVEVPPEPVDQRIAAAAANAVTGQARIALREARAATTAARSALDQLRGQLRELGDVDRRKADVDRRRLAISLRRSGFVLVEQAFGRNGIQALEIDAAGPEVSTLTNELLAEAFGPRFTINLRTIQEAGGGRVQKEVFDVIVTDAERMKPGSFESFSVGEKTLIDEALKLAIVLFNQRRHGGQFETLWRDEPDAGLSDEMATRYPGMLRRAMLIGHFRNAFFSTHRPASSAQADHFLHVGDGRAILESA